MPATACTEPASRAAVADWRPPGLSTIMKFGIFYEHQLPRPGWRAPSSRCIKRRWTRWSSPTATGSTMPGRWSTTSLRSIRTPPPPRCFSPPAHSAAGASASAMASCSCRRPTIIPRVAERIATLDLVSAGRVEGHGARRLGRRDGWHWRRSRSAVGDVARGRTRGRQHAGDEPLPRLCRHLLLHALSQRGAQAGAEAASADLVR